MRQACAHTALNTSGELLYCYNRGDTLRTLEIIRWLLGIITCCFENHTCVEDWTKMQNRVYTTAKWSSKKAWKSGCRCARKHKSLKDRSMLQGRWDGHLFKIWATGGHELLWLQGVSLAIYTSFKYGLLWPITILPNMTTRGYDYHQLESWLPGDTNGISS